MTTDIDHTSVTLRHVLVEAGGLLSEHGENPEYDRAIVELATRLIGRSHDDHAIVHTACVRAWSRYDADGTIAPATSADAPPLFDDEPEAPPIAPADVERIVVEYVKRVQGNTTPDYDATAAVLAAIDNRMDRWDIVMEMGETAYDLGIVFPDYDNDPDGVDAWNDCLDDALPTVAERLRA